MKGKRLILCAFAGMLRCLYARSPWCAGARERLSVGPSGAGPFPLAAPSPRPPAAPHLRDETVLPPRTTRHCPRCFGAVRAAAREIGHAPGANGTGAVPMVPPCGLAAPARPQSGSFPFVSFFENEVIVETLWTLHTAVRFLWLRKLDCCFNIRKFDQIPNIWVILDMKSL